MLIKFSKDEVVIPRESEWFGEYQPDKSIKPVTETDFYKDDFIGFK